jgi:hypothetical protein
MRMARPFLDAPGRMLRDPFLRFDLPVPRAVKRQLQGRSLLGRHAELNLFADGGGREEANSQNDCFEHRRTPPHRFSVSASIAISEWSAPLRVAKCQHAWVRPSPPPRSQKFASPFNPFIKACLQDLQYPAVSCGQQTLDDASSDNWRALLNAQDLTPAACPSYARRRADNIAGKEQLPEKRVFSSTRHSPLPSKSVSILRPPSIVGCAMQALPPPSEAPLSRASHVRKAPPAFSACACGAPICWAPRTARAWGWLSLGAGTQPVAFGLGKQALGVLG